MAIESFVDPYTKYPLRRNDSGDLFYQQGEKLVVYKNYNGIIDFTCSNMEREHYDNLYGSLTDNQVRLEEVYEQWRDKRNPENLILLESLGDLWNKRILLLGNGTSSKEFYFLKLGANIVYTDLSLQAVTLMRSTLWDSELKELGCDNIEFHAIDALNLPFPDSSFGVIYGYSFAHHIEDLNRLFSEVNRCLKKGGICRFCDDAYSPIWQFAKATILRPLQLYTHKTIGLSPEDRRATKRGGYREDELRKIMHEFGFNKLLFVRVSFFRRLFYRGVGKLLGYDHYLIRKESPFMLWMERLDDYCAEKSDLMRKNLINLVWGFDK